MIGSAVEGTAMTTSGEMSHDAQTVRRDFALERYRYILQQIHTVNENAHRFLAIYQTLTTTLVGAALTLFVGYEKWAIDPATARDGIVGLLIVATLVAIFTITLIAAGAASWLDYRNEECDITDEMVGPGFRERPKPANFLRWYETYVSLFIVCSMVLMWVLVVTFVLPAVK
ncbi:hypothetical protein ACFQ9U_10515 [Streptomyces sp. NPDC056568]|uniref:hypothetical protein n=1 Tax=Streptomyces sp. NPDC056568 TaxID=3345866 RepID=UPI0036A59389